MLETANYDPAVCKLETGKIGRGEFGRVMLAAYTLYQCILPDCGDLEVNGEKVESDFLLDGSITFWGQVIPNSVPQRRCRR